MAAGDGRRTVAPAPIDVLCELGAPDAFGGTLCHPLLSGWPLERWRAFANVARAIVASRLLCSPAIPNECGGLGWLEESPA